LRTTPAEASGCAASYRSEDTKTTSTRARPVRACLRRTTSAPVISGSLIFGTADRAATRPPRSTLRRAIPSSYLTPAFGGENQASAQRSRLVFNQQNARWVIVVVQPDSFQPRPTDTAIVKWSVPTVRSGQSCGEGGGVHRLIGRASDDQGRMTASKSSSLANSACTPSDEMPSRYAGKVADMARVARSHCPWLLWGILVIVQWRPVTYSARSSASGKGWRSFRVSS
jgi:hypothetical protein